MRKEYNINQEQIDTHTLFQCNGDSLIDSSPYHRNITNYGVTVSDSGKFGKSLRFGGNGKFQIDLGDDKITDGVFTFECWIKLDNTSKSYKCIWDCCNHSIFYFDASDNRDGTLVLIAGAAAWQQPASMMKDGSVLFSATDYVHVAIVGDGVRNKLYINGVEKTTSGWTGCTNKLNMTNGLITFGNINLSGLNRPLLGNLEEIRISNVARYTENFTPRSLR